MTNNLFSDSTTRSGEVICFGQSFPNDEARREHFTRLLAEKLKDPAFRKNEGFPQGTDEAILAMSDPPYYTACPNPFLEDFVRHCGKPYDPGVKYSREPQTIDVSVGKTDPIYKAHSYHTKVPYLAIVPSILHYTEPGEIVLDSFGGSGMTGVAAQWCGSAPAAYRHELETEWKKLGKSTPKWGVRHVIVNDLSPAATFIASNNNIPFDVSNFEVEAKRLLQDAERELGWMYKTKHTDGNLAHISYVVWSEVFVCTSCAGETVFFEAAYDAVANKVRNDVTCAHCGAVATKENMDLQFESFMDEPHKRVDKRPKRVPVLIKYSVGRSSFTKVPDSDDLAIIAKISQLGIPRNLPTDELPDCQMTRVGRMRTTNTRCIHHMYLPRAAHLLSHLWGKANEIKDARLRNAIKYWLDSQFTNMSILNRYRPEVSFPYNPLSGVFYVPSLISEADPFTAYANKIKRLTAAFSASHAKDGISITSCGSAAKLLTSDESVDYIFTDPPFGENIYYADLNILVESWHRVLTDVKPEAIVDRVRQKGVPEYQQLMRACFSEYYRVLKPGRWMTVVFSNSRASVWNAIQVALQQVGFVVAEVTALDKVQGSFQQVVSPNTVKQDLVISAYKPNGGLEERFNRSGATIESAWDFVQTHLKQLPSVKVTSGFPQELLNIVERDPRRIYDRMASWFIRHGAMVPISTPEFLAELPVRFREMDGMVFLPDQLVEYEKARSRIPQVKQAELFVSDERSAIDWLTNFLLKRPSTRSEIHPEYIPQIGSAKRKGEIIPELDQLLEDNFLKYDGTGEVPSQIHSYLSSNHKDQRGLGKSDPALVAKAKDRWYVPDPNKAQDLEKKREKALLKEFETYKAFSGRKIKESRLEVLRAGFRAAWAAKDYQTIIGIANKLPEETLQEDEKLLTLYDLALTRTEDGI
ncbi:DNA methyltransferase [Pseudomonas aeruginosa]|uniref:DNA methyltransferase n=1 Tax=Pseudomonas aeruginosa TaxID=287 RepID=UPI0008482E5A|nr:DNA methyltransferase [Pseudomonas aeruginosa]AON09740.1 DNA methylase [Pseudomonas aeruginosa]AON15723.1 DNA methylase [Pseudomonas aeruginosa]AON21733.1 DNA methylase [Pseudomonas aeruginosa]AON27718.1 DNA methylase [Pseudomonas aeruginosa]AON33726.1 DNA methylase [Pseudomonas aeruginosa]